MNKLILAAFATALLGTTATYADPGKGRGHSEGDGPPKKTKAATGCDFCNEQVPYVRGPNGKKIIVGTAKADLNCEKVFDSAEPVSMLFELGKIVGPAIVLGKVPEVSGYDEKKRDELFSNLRALAKHKIWLPVSMEKKIGDLLHDTYVEDRKAVDPEGLNRDEKKRYAQTKKIFDGILKNLPEDNPFEFRLGVVVGDEFNATTNPGGYVYVSQGLLRDTRLKDDELAVILAHEVAHVTKRHSLKDWQSKLVDAMELGKDLKAILNMTKDPASALKSMTSTIGTGRMLFQKFDHAQEFEGDSCGIQLAAGNKSVDVESGVKQYAMRNSGRNTPKSWQESHPSSEERIAIMHKQVIRVKNGDRIVVEDGGAGTTSLATGDSGSTGKEEPGMFSGLKGMFGGGKSVETASGNSSNTTTKSDSSEEKQEGGWWSSLSQKMRDLPTTANQETGSSNFSSDAGLPTN